jgi:hypothetical protein
MAKTSKMVRVVSGALVLTVSPTTSRLRHLVNRYAFAWSAIAHRCRDCRARLVAGVLAVVLTIAASTIAQGQTLPGVQAPKNAVSSEWERIREGLRQAKPIPEPTYAVRPDTSTESGGLLRFDPISGNTSPVPSSNYNGNVLPSGGSPEEGRPSAVPSSVDGTKSLESSLRRQAGISGIGSPATTPVRPSPANATPPGPLYYPYSFPWNTEFRLLMRFFVPGFGDRYYLCSASSVSTFHLLSAGHCVYNHDPLDDHSGRGAGFAAEIWAWPAETDVVDPTDHSNWPDFPYGVAKMTRETTYNAWINSSDLNWDMSFIALDRRIGDHVGWMGREWGVFTTALNFDGYPAEAPYVPSDNPYQYPGFDAGNIVGYTCCRIALNAYTYGGHSGGGVWRYDGTNTYLEGVNSTSNRVGYAEATLFTGQSNTDLVNTISTDQSLRPPTDRAQLIEYVFNSFSKGLVDTSVLLGNSFRLTLNAFNAGYVPAGITTADIYLTTNSNSVVGGTYVGTVNLGSIGTYEYTVQTRFINVPNYVFPGHYYVGWVLGGANQQYGTDKNDAIITAQVLTVVPPSNNANLSNLTVSSGTLMPAFASTTLSYTDSVANSVTSITVTPTVADNTATVKVNGTPVISGTPSGPISLSVGSNLITVLVTAQDAITTKTYTISVNRAPSNVNVPNVVGLTQAAATTAITSAGLVVGTVTMQPSMTTPAGSVISQMPIAGTSVPSGSAVNLVVSIGLSLGDASNLAYKPVEPCRIMDTRNATVGSGVQGPISGGSLKQLPGFITAGSNWSIYGQTAPLSDCGLTNPPGSAIHGIAIVITVLNPNFDAFIGVSDVNSFTTTLSTVALNYAHGQGLSTMYFVPQIGSNNIYFALPAGLSAQIIFDVVGYYVLSDATALQCTTQTSGPVTVGASSSGNATSAACVGYTLTAGSCDSDSSNMKLVADKASGQSWFCSANNLGGSSAHLTATANCCRVPGK